MRFRRRKTEPPAWPEREPDLYLDGKPMWVVIPTPVVANGNSYDEGRGLTVLDGKP